MHAFWQPLRQKWILRSNVYKDFRSASCLNWIFIGVFHCVDIRIYCSLSAGMIKIHKVPYSDYGKRLLTLLGSCALRSEFENHCCRPGLKRFDIFVCFNKALFWNSLVLLEYPEHDKLKRRRTNGFKLTIEILTFVWCWNPVPKKAHIFIELNFTIKNTLNQ